MGLYPSEGGLMRFVLPAIPRLHPFLSGTDPAYEREIARRCGTHYSLLTRRIKHALLCRYHGNPTFTWLLKRQIRRKRAPGCRGVTGGLCCDQRDIRDRRRWSYSRWERRCEAVSDRGFPVPGCAPPQ